jgi:hypothetical protein
MRPVNIILLDLIILIIVGEEQGMEFVIMQLSTTSCHFMDVCD